MIGAVATLTKHMSCVVAFAAIKPGFSGMIKPALVMVTTAFFVGDVL